MYEDQEIKFKDNWANHQKVGNAQKPSFQSYVLYGFLFWFLPPILLWVAPIWLMLVAYPIDPANKAAVAGVVFWIFLPIILAVIAAVWVLWPEPKRGQS